MTACLLTGRALTPGTHQKVLESILAPGVWNARTYGGLNGAAWASGLQFSKCLDR